MLGQERLLVGVSDQNRGAGGRERGIAARALVPDSGGAFHPVQRHVQQARADHAALGNSLPGHPSGLPLACGPQVV